jgi:peptidoglycan/xylan/chitin deacetylase (PgdA/CDA1 family)
VKVLLTIDVEAHRTIDEITGEKHDSLGDILHLLSEWGVKATCFIDVCAVERWGRTLIQSVCDRLTQGGHDVQLHVHPHHYTRDNARWLLSEYTRSEQERIFEYSFAQFEALTGRKPTAFRAGGFGLNDDTIDILRSRGVQVDASYMYLKKGSSISPERIGAPSRFRGLIEVPMTPAITMGTRSRPLRSAPIDFNWLPLFVIKGILRTCRSRGSPVAVVLMHSSSMCVRVNRTKVVYRRSHFRKLGKLLRFLREEGFEHTTFSELSFDQMIQSDGGGDMGVYVERNPVVQYVTLLFQSFKGVGISPRFALFFYGNLLVGLVVLLFLCRGLVGRT